MSSLLKLLFQIIHSGHFISFNHHKTRSSRGLTMQLSLRSQMKMEVWPWRTVYMPKEANGLVLQGNFMIHQGISKSAQYKVGSGFILVDQCK